MTVNNILLAAFAAIFPLLALTQAAAGDAATPAPAVAAAHDEVVTMEKFEVNASRFRWSHAQTSRFEILSNLEETKFVASVVTQAEQIISVFEDTSPLFTQQLDLPAKIIFIQDEIVERLFSRANIGATNGDYEERMAGSPYHKNTAQFRNDYKISAFANHNDEQLVIVKFLTKNYMTGSLPDGPNGRKTTPERQRILECAADLAVTYLSECAQIHAGGKKILWLDAALNAMRGHIYGGKFHLPRDFSSPVYGKGSYYRTGWIDINTRLRGVAITLGRYCLACELDAIQTAADFPFISRERRAFWTQFMASPDAISLGEIFNGAYAQLPDKTAPMEHQLLMQREVHDFMYYCLLGPDDAARDAFTKLVLASAAGPVDEPLFQKTFGSGYAEFQAKIYDYYRKLSRDSDPFNVSRRAPNPWGDTGFTVTLPSGANTSPRVKFTLARRPDTSRIIGDWFDAIGAGANARASLLKAYDESQEAARDPQFLATLGLNEARYGNHFLAADLLEKAAAANIARPGVYRTLARLRLQNIIDLKGAAYRLSPAEFTGILEPLNTAFSQPRPSPQNYIIYAALCEHTDVKSPVAYENRVAEACQIFPDDIDMLETILPPFAKSVSKTVAVRLARDAAKNSLPSDKKQRLDKLVETLNAR